MAERDRAAVDVDLVLVDAEHPDRVQRHRRERLVDLPQVDVLGLQARPSRAPSWPPWRACAPGRRSRRRPAAWATIVGQRAPCRWPWPTRREASTSAPPPSLTPGELPAVCVPSLMKIGGQLGQRLERWRRGAGASSTSTTVSPFRPLIVTGTISSGRRPSSVALIAQLVRAQRPAVHVGARHLELGGDLGGLLRPCACRENGLVRPSLIIASIALPSPMRKPKRASLSR